MMHNIRSGAIRWQIPDFLSDSDSNCLHFQPLVVEIVMFEHFSLDNTDRFLEVDISKFLTLTNIIQGQDVQHLL